jgi:hypothetical protein
LATTYAELTQQWRASIEEVVRRDALRRDMAEQLLLAGRALGQAEQIMAQISVQFRRALAEVS